MRDDNNEKTDWSQVPMIKIITDTDVDINQRLVEITEQRNFFHRYIDQECLWDQLPQDDKIRVMGYHAHARNAHPHVNMKKGNSKKYTSYPAKKSAPKKQVSPKRKMANPKKK